MFAGIIIRASRADPRDLASPAALLDALTPYGQADRCGVWQGDGALLVQALTWNTAESKHEAVPEQCPVTGRVIVSWLRLDNRGDLCAALGIAERPELTDPQLVLAAYHRWGEECPDRLEGDFSFAIYDPANHRLFCARDCTGARSFFYALRDDAFVFATTAAVFPAIRLPGIAPSEAWMARYLMGMSERDDECAFDGVRKLPPAHRLAVIRTGAPRAERYFEFRDTAPFRLKRDEAWVRDYRETFHRAVEDRLRTDWRIGAETSGGLDTSTVLAHAARHMGPDKGDLHCFGLSHLEQEPQHILATPMYCGVAKNHILTMPPYIRDPAITERAIRTLGYPPENELASLYHWFFEQCGLNGIRTLLSGYGGDEAATSHAQHLPHELAAAGAWRTLWRELPGNPVMRALRLARLKWSTQRTDSAGYVPGPSFVERDQYLPLNDAARSAYPFLPFVAEQMRVLRDPQLSVNEHILRRFAHPYWGGQIAGRMEGCQLMANSYRVEYRWPMLDRRLIGQYLATPSIQKRKGAMGRYLHRQACEGEVPPAILWKQAKNMGWITQRGRAPTPDVLPHPEELPSSLKALLDLPKLRSQIDLLENFEYGSDAASTTELICTSHSVKQVNDLATYIRFWT